MGTEHLISALYVIPMILCLRAFSISSEAYDKLPDKIPMHFNFRGKADQWWPKRFYSVYFMPSVCVFTLVLIYGMVMFINSETGYMPDTFNFAFWLFACSIIYLTYRTQVGIIQYAIQEADNIWPFMSKGLFLLTVACLLMISSIFIYKEPIVLEAVTCSRIVENQPSDNKNSFSKSDPQATIWVNLMNVMGKHHVRMQWINPEGQEHFVYDQHTHKKVLAKYIPMWSYIYLNKNRESITAGRWQINVYLNQKKMLTREFTVGE